MNKVLQNREGTQGNAPAKKVSIGVGVNSTFLGSIFKFKVKVGGDFLVS